MTQPKLPFFDRLETNNVEPPEPKKDAGTKSGLPEAAQYMNWLFVQGWQWFRGLQGAYADIVVGTAGQVTSKDATHTIANFAAAVANGDKILILDGTQTLAANVLITETDVEVFFQTEAIIAKASTFTFTISGARSRTFNGRFSGFGTNDLVLSGGDSLWNISEGLIAWFNVGTSQVIGPGFIKGNVLNISGLLVVTNAAPELVLLETGVAADNGRWNINAQTTQLRMRLVNDADSAATNWLTVDRTGMIVDTITFPNGIVRIDDTTPSTSSTTGAFTVAGGLGVVGDIFTSGKIEVESTQPVISLVESDQGADEKRWRTVLGSGNLFFATRTDADGAGEDWLAVARTGIVIDSVTFPNGVLLVTDGIQVDTIDEITGGNGVVVDGLAIKDSGFKTGGTAIIRPGGIILSSVADVTRTTTGNFLTLTVPANTLNGDGKTLRVRVFGVTTGAGGTKLIKLNWAAIDFAPLIVAAGSQDWSLECVIVRESLDNQQGAQTGMESAGAQVCDVKDFTGDESTNIDIIFTLQSITGGGDITMKAITVELLN